MIKQEKKFIIDYPPLKTSGEIEVVGSVPDVQVYQADTEEYTPDYTLSPLTLFPRCNAIDKEAVVKVSSVNSSLVNMKWYERIEGVRTLITSTNQGYTITEAGTSKGKIQVKKNAYPGRPITLEFYAEYVPPKRKGETYVYQYTRLIRAVDGSPAQPKLVIDSPSCLDWNPCRDIDNQVINASLFIGDMDVTSTGKCKFFFYRQLSTGALEQIVDGNGDNDFDVVAITASSLTIDRNMIGYDQVYVVKASYAAEGNPASTPDSDIEYASTAIRRRIPTVEIDWQGAPQQVAEGTTMLHLKPIVRDTVGILPNPEKVFGFEWYTKAEGAAGYTLVATGSAPSIPFTDGMMVRLNVYDKGPYALLVNDDGKYVVTDDNKFIINQKRKDV